MTAVAPATRRAGAAAPLDPALDRRFEAVVFDWTTGPLCPTATRTPRGCASSSRSSARSAWSSRSSPARTSTTSTGSLARPSGPGRLHFLVNRGSEVFEAAAGGIRLLERREAARGGERGARPGRRCHGRGARSPRHQCGDRLERLNRRKIDLIPAWADPPKAEIAELLRAVEELLYEGGIGGLRAAVDLGVAAAQDAGIPEPRVTSDAKHVEIGLTDKSDSARWILADLWRRGIAPSQVLIAGDEFGPLGGLTGSDSYLLVPEAIRATVVTVGVEPTGVPSGIVAAPGGPATFFALLADQRDRRRRGDVSDVDEDPAWAISVDGFDTRLERVHESLLTLADGRLKPAGPR